MTSRAQPPPTNLKERIAALQQRNVSGGERPSSPSASVAAGPNTTGLRDRIAKFEKKGGVPVPRGSFGLGAPPLAENGPLKRRGELYGNRMPSAVRPSGGGPPISRSDSPFDTTRSFSMPALDGEITDADAANYLPHSPSSPSSPSSPFQNALTPQHTGLTPQHTGASKDFSSRSTPFSTALEVARRAEANLEASLRPIGREASRSPSPAPACVAEQVEEKVNQDTPVSQEPLPPPEQPVSDDIPAVVARVTEDAVIIEASPASSPPSIVLYPSPEIKEQQATAPLEDDPAQIIAASIVASEPNSEPAFPPTVDQVAEEPVQDVPPIAPSALPKEEELTLPAKQTAEVEPTVQPEPKLVPPVILTSITPQNEVKPIVQAYEVQAREQEEVPASPASALSPEMSPMGPFTLANAVHDLGRVVANIQDMFPGQISPISTPLPAYRSFRADTPTQGRAKSDESNKTSINPPVQTASSSIPEPHSKDTSYITTASETQTTASRVPHTSKEVTSTNLLAAPRSSGPRPVSMIETSPTQVIAAPRTAPHTSRNPPVHIPQQNNYDHFPPTPDVTEFGTISLHKPSRSVSEATSSNISTFSAVVHRKVTELPPVASASYKSFYSKVPETPHTNRTQPSAIEPPLSPGYGELATLLHEAALLELTLEQGELPSEKQRREEAERVQKEKEDKLREEKEAVARAKVDEERKKHATMTKARAKQEASESKSKSSFRNPLSRSKTSHKRDVSTDSAISSNPSRSKSVLLPFRPQATPPSRQNTPTPIATIPEKEVAPSETTPTRDHAEVSSQTSPKSPRHYFAGLKRLANSSRSSTTSQSRNSVSASSEMSSEDSISIPTPPGNGLDSATSNGSIAESGHGGLFGGSSIAWPSLSPKKSPGLGRAASFTEKIFGRGRTKSTISANSSTSSAYETIDRLTKSAAAKSAAALIPPLDPVSFSIDVPTLHEAPLTSPSQLPSPPELVSPRRSASLYVPATSQFPPVLSARPTSSIYTPLPLTAGIKTSSALDSVSEDKLASPVYTPYRPEATQSIDALFSAKPTSPIYTAPGPEENQSLNALFSAKPTSPVYTPHVTQALGPEPVAQSIDVPLFTIQPTSPVYTPHLATRSEVTISEVHRTSPDAESLLPSSKDYSTRPESYMSDLSMDSSVIPSPFYDSFPSVPDETPLPPALPGRQRNFNRPSLPLSTPSFFDTAPLSSTVVGAEFSAMPSPFTRNTSVRSATLPRASSEYIR